MRQLRTLLTVIGAVTVLVLAANTVSLAATGQGFLLGKVNSANKQTTLARTTNGPVLKLTNKNPGGAPLTVNGKGKVTNLNADKVDGLDANMLTTNPYLYTHTINVGSASNGFQLNLPLPAGRYILSYATYMISSPSAALGDVDCYLQSIDGGPASYFAENRSTTTHTLAGATGTGLVTKTATSTLSLKCSASVPFYVSSGAPVQIIATPVGRLLANAALRNR